MIYKFIGSLTTIVGMVAVMFATTDSTFFVNKPVAPASLLKK